MPNFRRYYDSKQVYVCLISYACSHAGFFVIANAMDSFDHNPVDAIASA